MEDSLQYMIAGQKESHSATAILGEDGRMTTAIIVGFSWHPGETDLQELKEILVRHGWEEEGSWFFPVEYIDSVVIDHVPVSSLIEIWPEKMFFIQGTYQTIIFIFLEYLHFTITYWAYCIFS